MAEIKDDGCRSAEVIQVIHTVGIRGKGTHESVSRLVDVYWSLAGQRLAEHDPCPEEPPDDQQ